MSACQEGSQLRRRRAARQHEEIGRSQNRSLARRASASAVPSRAVAGRVGVDLFQHAAWSWGRPPRQAGPAAPPETYRRCSGRAVVAHRAVRGPASRRRCRPARSSSNRWLAGATTATPSPGARASSARPSPAANTTLAVAAGASGRAPPRPGSGRRRRPGTKPGQDAEPGRVQCQVAGDLGRRRRCALAGPHHRRDPAPWTRRRRAATANKDRVSAVPAVRGQAAPRARTTMRGRDGPRGASGRARGAASPASRLARAGAAARGPAARSRRGWRDRAGSGGAGGRRCRPGRSAGFARTGLHAVPTLGKAPSGGRRRAR